MVECLGHEGCTVMLFLARMAYHYRQYSALYSNFRCTLTCTLTYIFNRFITFATFFLAKTSITMRSMGKNQSNTRPTIWTPKLVCNSEIRKNEYSLCFPLVRGMACCRVYDKTVPQLLSRNINQGQQTSPLGQNFQKSFFYQIFVVHGLL